MVRVTLVWGVGKRWLELQSYVWRRDGWTWVTVARSVFHEDEDTEESLEQKFQIVIDGVRQLMDDADAEGVQAFLPC